jgi:hypothetical protein
VAHGGVLGDVLLEEPGGELAGQRAGAALPLVEGDESVLLIGVEPQLEGGLGLLEPLSLEALAPGFGR